MLFRSEDGAVAASVGLGHPGCEPFHLYVEGRLAGVTSAKATQPVSATTGLGLSGLVATIAGMAAERLAPDDAPVIRKTRILSLYPVLGAGSSRGAAKMAPRLPCGRIRRAATEDRPCP